MTEDTRAGHVALIGLPNAGKSSLLNRFLGSKLSIVTPRAQTTRERVVGIDTRDGVQMIFLDTPGIVDPAYLLHHAMIGSVGEAVADADVVVLLLDATREPPAFTDEILVLLSGARQRLLPVINKIDTAAPQNIQKLEAWVQEQLGSEPMRISAETGTGVEVLRTAIASKLPPSPLLYPDDDVSTQTMRFFTAELVREAVFELYEEEIPYSVAVKIDEFREESDPLFIRATLYVERPTQKGILIGKNGVAIKALGSRAREKIEAFVEQRVYLDLWIKVLPRWRKDPIELNRLGFRIPLQPE